MQYLSWMRGDISFHDSREKKYDNPTTHLLKFHEVMYQLGIHHEDVLMKMSMYSLEGEAQEWYFPLLASNIFSLRDFHVVFNKRCKRYFSHELLMEDCYEYFELCIQQTVECYSCNELCKYIVEKQIKEEFVFEENISNFSFQKELGTEQDKQKKERRSC